MDDKQSPTQAKLVAAMAGRRQFGRQITPHHKAARDYPLVIALHGGTYTSAYFDVRGYSLLDRAAALGIPTIALDRPGYGQSTPLAADDATILGNAEQLDAAIGEIWRQQETGARGVVLIGHSIGGAIAVAIAARQPAWPLLGIAISGVGLIAPPNSMQPLPDVPMIELPQALKDSVMMGPEWTYDAEMPEAGHVADAATPRAELIDIRSFWPSEVHALAVKVRVPVQYRQAEFDRLWVTDAEQAAVFGAGFSDAPFVDAALYKSAGHCIDFHRLGAAFQIEQLAFALRCAVMTASLPLPAGS